MQVQPGLNNHTLSGKKSKLVLDSSEEQNTVALFQLNCFLFSVGDYFYLFFCEDSNWIKILEHALPQRYTPSHKFILSVVRIYEGSYSVSLCVWSVMLTQVACMFCFAFSHTFEQIWEVEEGGNCINKCGIWEEDNPLLLPGACS